MKRYQSLVNDHAEGCDCEPCEENRQNWAAECAERRAVANARTTDMSASEYLARRR